MDDRQSIGGGSANSSSDFVSCFAYPSSITWGNGNLLTFRPGAKALQVFQPSYNYSFSHGHDANQTKRMLEDPSYSQVVRWGDDGGSFVVLEVQASQQFPSTALADTLRRMKDSPNLFCPNISNIATSPASCASLTNMISTRCDTIMRRMGTPRTARV